MGIMPTEATSDLEPFLSRPLVPLNLASERRDWDLYEILYLDLTRYIGKDGNWPSRRDAHIRESKKDKPNQLCEIMMAKIGWIHIVRFEFDLTEDEANAREMWNIAHYQTNRSRHGSQARGYNLTDGGDGASGYARPAGEPAPNSGVAFAQDHQDKLKESAKHRPVRPGSHGWNIKMGNLRTRNSRMSDGITRDIDINLAVEMWKDGHSLRVIGKEVGCNHGTVKNRLRKLGEYEKRMAARVEENLDFKSLKRDRKEAQQ